jgi:hypothetical protein
MTTHQHRRRPRPTARDRRIPPGRTLHLIDIENLAGADRELADLLAAGRAYFQAVQRRPGDHVVVGCDRTLMLAARIAFPGARIVAGHGPDGADRALIGCERRDDIARRYDRVVIGSGDHVFCELAADLRRRGLAVCVVARHESLSRDLRRVAGLVIDLRMAA